MPRRSGRGRVAAGPRRAGGATTAGVERVEEAALETPQLEVSQAQRKLAPCLRDPGFISPDVFAPERERERDFF